MSKVEDVTRNQFVRWYEYAACFAAGVFLTNSVLHVIHGIGGDLFPHPSHARWAISLYPLPMLPGDLSMFCLDICSCVLVSQHYGAREQLKHCS